MDKLDIIVMVMGGYAVLNLSLLLIIWNSLNNRIDKVGERIDRLSDRVDDIDRRLCRIEGSLATQGHCLFGQREERKAE